MEFLYLIFYAYLRLGFPDVESNPDSRRPVPTVCRLLCCNVLGLAVNLSDLTLASSRYNILLCSDRRCWFLDLVALPFCSGAGCLGSEGWWHTYEKDMEHFANISLSMVVSKCRLLGFVV